MTTKQDIIDGLQNLLADTYLLYIKTQGFHWNVVGAQFGPLHQMFQVQYEELALANDLIAERIRALGGYAAGSSADFTKHGSLKEAGTPPRANAMIQELQQDHEKIAEECNQFMVKMDNVDIATENLLADRAAAHEKTAWMLRSHLE